MALKRINKKAVEDIVTFAWQVSRSFVFDLTGAEIFITSLGIETLGLCLATMILAVAVGIVATLVIGSGFHGKETLFIPLVWISKATVQEGYAERSEDSRKDYWKFISFYQRYGIHALLDQGLRYFQGCYTSSPVFFVTFWEETSWYPKENN